MVPSPLVQKLKLKEGQRGALLNAPSGYRETLAPFPAGAVLEDELEGRFDWVQLFVTSRAELDAVIDRVVRSLGERSLLWICFPKRSSGIQTDLTRDAGWESVRARQLKWVTLVSLTDAWSAFCLRPYREGEQGATRRQK
jgi:hypothetical protein